ncbi:protein lifeguard 2-like isoform X10 [Ovis canadensis]|uniref:protein lifeguard 2-like isoform X10 n=1 Tax=Ovis canadensis TaxID=37174 RepID=UPI00375259F2
MLILGASLFGPMELYLRLRSHNKLVEIHTQRLVGEQILMWYRFHQRLLQTTSTLAHFQKQLSAEQGFTILGDQESLVQLHTLASLFCYIYCTRLLWETPPPGACELHSPGIIFLQGLLLGTVSVFYNAEEVLWATGATALVTLSLSLFALQTKWDFTLLNGMLFVLLFVLIIYGIILIFIRSYWLHLLYAGLGTVIFSLYLVMDVQLMVGGRHHHSDLDPEEYVFAALNIYMDIINLFLFILQLIGMGR